MRHPLADRLAVLSGWPRRLAAIACLLVAAASALGSVNGSAAPSDVPAPQSPAARLPPGEVLVPVELSGRADFLHPGDHVDLLVSAGDGSSEVAASVGTRLLVVQVSHPPSQAFAAPDTGSRLLVAASRPVAAKIVAAASGRVIAVLDADP